MIMKLLSQLLLTLCFPIASFATAFFVTDIDDMPLKGVVVYISGIDSANLPLTGKKSIDIHQTDKKFSPYITVVKQSQSVRFINDDNITHHIYAAKGPERFSFKLRSKAPPKELAFSQLGDVAMGCNIHDWMGGHILVVPTAYYGVTGKNGQVTIKNLPDGPMTVTVWHPQLDKGGSSQDWQVSGSAPETMRLQVQGKLRNIPNQEAPDDIDYFSVY